MGKGRNWAPLRGVLWPVAAVLVLIFFTTSLNGLESGRAAEDQRQLEETLRRSCAASYAAEGVYPPNLEYLEKRYGVQVDENRYTVFYDVFADNLMPDITVLENAS